MPNALIANFHNPEMSKTIETVFKLNSWKYQIVDNEKNVLEILRKNDEKFTQLWIISNGETKLN